MLRDLFNGEEIAQKVVIDRHCFALASHN